MNSLNRINAKRQTSLVSNIQANVTLKVAILFNFFNIHLKSPLLKILSIFSIYNKVNTRLSKSFIRIQSTFCDFISNNTKLVQKENNSTYVINTVFTKDLYDTSGPKRKPYTPHINS